MMLQLLTISRVQHPRFEEWWQLYEAAFPVTERRSAYQHAAAMQHAAFRCVHLSDEVGFAGIMAYWEWPHLVFLEHLAVVPERRGQGLGHQSLALLPDKVVLEIEPVVDAPTGRRLRFYESCGFCRQPHPHVQLAYQAGQPDVPLWLLSRPRISWGELELFEREYHAGPMRYRDMLLK